MRVKPFLTDILSTEYLTDLHIRLGRVDYLLVFYKFKCKIFFYSVVLTLLYLFFRRQASSLLRQEINAFSPVRL